MPSSSVIAVPELTRWQRVSSYGLARKGRTVLMVRIGPDEHGDAGKWMLPGGGVEHGEHPAATVVREFAEETGYEVHVDRLLEVGSDHRLLPGGIDFHGVYVVYEVSVRSGAPRAEENGQTRAPSWLTPDQLAAAPMLDTVRDVLSRWL